MVDKWIGSSLLVAAGFACACTESPMAAPGDAGLPPDASSGGGEPPALINPSRYNTILGRPTDSSIAISILAAAKDKAFVEYGTTLNAARTEILSPLRSEALTSIAGEPIVIDLNGLQKDTRYYYRVRYQPGGQGDIADNLHTFHTQRAIGRTFRFGVQGDTHPERFNNKMFHKELFTLTMGEVQKRQPDLYFLLGDDFSIERIVQLFKEQNYAANYLFKKSVEGAAPYLEYQKLKIPFMMPMIVDGAAAPAGNAAYLEMRKQYLGIAGNSSPLMLVNGNHEQASLANIGGIFNNASIWAADARLKYYPLPAPGTFYTGDAKKMLSTNGYPTISASDGLLRDYYAFTWGDALFVTIDPYWHSENMPESSLYNGDTNNDIWNSTLGNEQYAWLKQTLEGSKAKWKFVFTHHVNGLGRGAAAVVPAGEWGGNQRDFKNKRPTWSKPIHQLLVDTKVTIFFQGHDHMYSREIVDGVIYQEVPNPGDNSYFAYNCDAYGPASINWQGPAGYGVYDRSYTVRLPDTGYLDVTVSPDKVRVDYIRTYREIDLKTNPNKIFTGKEVNGEVAFSYSVPAQPGDNQAKDVQFVCMGAAPPADWVFNP